MGNRNPKTDLENYQKGYPDLLDDETISDNYRFYLGEIPSEPKGDYISNIHDNFLGKTDLLEVQRYIGWLFPTRDPVVNGQSKPLQKHEILKIKSDPVCMQRFLKSYEIMLHFYGCKLKDSKTGEIERHEGWKNQYNILNDNIQSHEHITYVLKSLGEFGFEHYKKPFLEHFIKEIWDTKELQNCEGICANWVYTLRDKSDREELENKVERKLFQNNDKEGTTKPYIDDIDDSDTEDPEDLSLLDEETKKNLQDQILKEDDDEVYQRYDELNGEDERGSWEEDDDQGDKDD